MKLVKVEEWNSTLLPNGNTIKYAVINDDFFASSEEWCSKLQYPHYEIWARKLEAATRKIEDRGDLARVKCDGGFMLYRWHAVDDALFETCLAFAGGKLKSSERRDGVIIDPWPIWNDQYERMRWAIANIVSKALTARYRSNADPASMDSGALISILLQRHDAKLSEHDQRLDLHSTEIAELKSKSAIPSDGEFFSAEIALPHLNINPNHCPLLPENSWTYAQCIGQVLAKKGAERGPVQLVRLPDSGLVREIKTWKFGDIREAVGHIRGLAARKLKRA